MVRKIGKMIRGFFIGVLSLLLLLNIWQLISYHVLHQNPPSAGGFSPVIVLSGSMEPAFSAGDLLIIKQRGSYRAGDIVTFEDGGALTTHRIIEQSPEGFITKGDHNNVPDGGKVSAEQIKGILVLRVPKAGAFLLFLRSPQGLLALAAFGAAVLFLPDMIKNWFSHRKECAD